MNEIFIAISRASLKAPIKVGSGLRFEPTYAHVFAHPMLAVKPPPEPGKHHPSPWTIVNSSGIVETATVQLVVDVSGRTERDALFQAHSLMALLRLMAGTPVRAPIFSRVEFANIAHGEKCDHVTEFEPPLRWDIDDFSIDEVAAKLPENLVRLEKLRQSDRFSNAFGLLDSIWWIPSLSAQMIAIWSSAETLMQPGRQNMTKELAKLVRLGLGNSKSDGDRFYNEVIRLCAARGSAAHAGREPDALDVQASYGIARALLLRAMIEEAAEDQAFS